MCRHIFLCFIIKHGHGKTFISMELSATLGQWVKVPEGSAS